MSASVRRLNNNLYRRCVNCFLSLPPHLQRRRVDKLDERIYNLLKSWVTPTVLTLYDVVCVECFVLLQNWTSSTTTLSLASPALGHRNVCYTCGTSIENRRSHKVSQNYPQRNVLLRWTPAHHILHLKRVCHPCWNAASRQMKSEAVSSDDEPTVESDWSHSKSCS